MNYKKMMEDIKKQEHELEFEKFTHDDAWELGKICAKLAKERDLGVVISIRMASGLTVFQHATPRGIPTAEIWLESKHKTVMTRYASTLYFHAFLNGNNKTLEGLKLVDNYTEFGGGFPIKVKNVGVIGSVSATGLYHFDDHNFIADCVAEFLGAKINPIVESDYKV